MHRERRSIRQWWVCILFFTVTGFGAESKSAVALEKPKGDTMALVQVAKEVRGMIVQIVVPSQNGNTSIGSGFWVDQRGYVATCWHVVRDNPTATMKVQSAIDPLC